MSKLSKILIGVWGCLAIISFISAFFAPLYFKIIGLLFGGLNMLTILSVIVTYFQGLYYNRKIQKEIEDGMQLQESETSTTKEEA